MRIEDDSGPIPREAWFGVGRFLIAVDDAAPPPFKFSRVGRPLTWPTPPTSKRAAVKAARKQRLRNR